MILKQEMFISEYILYPVTRGYSNLAPRPAVVLVFWCTRSLKDPLMSLIGQRFHSPGVPGLNRREE